MPGSRELNPRKRNTSFDSSTFSTLSTDFGYMSKNELLALQEDDSRVRTTQEAQGNNTNSIIKICQTILRLPWSIITVA